MTVNQAFIVENGGWHYYEFDVSAVAQTLVTNGVCQIAFWSNDSRSVPVYLDDFSFIVS